MAMTGPPTPPPSSAIEIEDATRSVEPMEATPAEPPAIVTEPQPAAEQPSEVEAEPVPVVEEAPEPAPPAPTSFRVAFDTLTKLAVDGRFKELVEAAEVADLVAVNDGHIDRVLVLAPLVLGYLILNDPEPALSALSRLPEPLRTMTIVEALFRLAASTSKRRYENVYPRAEALHAAVQQTPIPDADLFVVVDILLTVFLDTFRRATFALLSRTYSSIPLTVAQVYLGWSADQVLGAASDFKWGYDTGSGILSPVALPKTGPAHIKGTISGVSSLTTFDLIANANLE